MNSSGDSTVIVFGLILTTAIAAMMLVGAWRRWRWLVDPPLRLWIAHPYALLRYFFGETAVVWVVYITAVVTLLFIVYSIARLRAAAWLVKSGERTLAWRQQRHTSPAALERQRIVREKATTPPDPANCSAARAWPRRCIQLSSPQ